MEPIYLDFNATTPIDPRVAEAMLPYIHTHFGNPSSSHPYGAPPRKAVDKARKQVARMLGCEPEEVIFTSGGTESNNYAIKGIAEACRHRGDHIITSSIEHPSVLEVCRYLEKKGFRVTYLPVTEDGRVDPRQVEEAATPRTILITVMHANNEVGTIQPIAEIAAIARRLGIVFHTDASQSAGKISVLTQELGVDLLTLAGHKLYAPKGVGALFIRKEIVLEKLIHGAGHEMGFRAGTENVIEIVGLGMACELIHRNLNLYRKHMEKLRDRLEEGLKESSPDIRIHGNGVKRLPNTASVGFPGVEANGFLARLKTVSASAGAACHSGSVSISHVLVAMGVPEEYAMGTVRFSLGRSTTTAEIRAAQEEIVRIMEKIGAGKKSG